MPLVLSSYVLDAHTQADGSRWCKEAHLDSEGRTQYRLYRLPAGQGTIEADANLATQAAYIDERLALAEVEAQLGA